LAQRLERVGSRSARRGYPDREKARGSGRNERTAERERIKWQDANEGRLHGASQRNAPQNAQADSGGQHRQRIALYQQPQLGPVSA